MVAKFGLLTLLPILVGGCTAGFTSSPYHDIEPGKPQEGLTYKLPRTVFDYSVRYALYKIIRTNNTPAEYLVWLDAALSPAETPPAQPITLTARMVGDDRAVFVINTNDLAAFNVWTKESKFSLHQDGVLAGANATFEDRTTEIFQKTLSAGLNLAKLSANPSGTTGRSLLDEDTTASITKLAVATVTGQIDYALLDARSPGTASLIYTVPYGAARRQLELSSGKKNFSFPQVCFTFTPDTRYRRLDAAQAAYAIATTKSLRHKSKHEGLWIRHPGSAGIAVVVDGTKVLSQRVSIADAGPTTLMPIKSRFATSRTQSLTFHPSGGVNEFSFSTTSQGETIATAADTASQTLATQVPAIIQQRQNLDDSIAATTAELTAERRKADDASQEVARIDRDLTPIREKYKKLDSTPLPADATPEQESQVAAEKAELNTMIQELERERKKQEYTRQDAESAAAAMQRKLNRL